MRRTLTLALFVFLSGTVSGNTTSLLEKRQLTQRDVPRACVATCSQPTTPAR